MILSPDYKLRSRLTSATDPNSAVQPRPQRPGFSTAAPTSK